jgi:hypothetical protein
MTWQPHCSGDALPPPQIGRWSESRMTGRGEQLGFNASFRVILVFFNIFDFIENKRTSSKLLIFFVVILNKCKIEHVNIASHHIDPRFEATRISTSAYILIFLHFLFQKRNKFSRFKK